MEPDDLIFNAWNPGLGSDIPPHLKESITLFRTENSDVSYKEAMLARELCGLKVHELCCLSVRRLIIHELLVRVTADLSVPDGPNYEDLGISLRSMATTLLHDHIDQHLDMISKQFGEFCSNAEKRIIQIFNQEFLQADNKNTNKKYTFEFLSMFKKHKSVVRNLSEPQDIKILMEWSVHTDSAVSFDDQCKAALAKVISGIIGVRGRLVADSNLFIPLVVRVFRNVFGGQEINRLINPLFHSAVNLEGYRYLPSQSKPIVMNTKGASASGKSTIRPQQRRLSERMNISWDDFALISPDYWRKFLLDYESLGLDYKYGAMLTGHELEIIDKKLDLDMAQKAIKGEMPHLLIDRFRFDSFAISGDGNYNSRLLTRFGEKVFLFFVVTSPTETVERAWKRGLSTSRYKAVDDLLYHNIEAYTGMPKLFFSWMAIKDKEINFEFLDNNVPSGDTPRTIAFGKIGHMKILDLKALNNIDLFKAVNVKARKPEEVLKSNYRSDFTFVKQCLAKISEVVLVDKETSEIYGRCTKGNWSYINKLYKPKTILEKECLLAIGWGEFVEIENNLQPKNLLKLEKEFTLGS